MSSTAFMDPTALLERFKKNRVQSGPRTDWHNLQQGKQTVRFVSDGTGDPFLEYRSHWGVSAEGKVMSCLDLDWLVSKNGADVLEACDLTREDVEEIGKHGDPANKLREALPHYDDWPKEWRDARNKPISKRQAISVAVVEGVVGLLRLPLGVFDTVIETFEENPSIISPDVGMDFVITKTGQGLGTSYTCTPVISSNGKPAEIHDAEAAYPSVAQGVARDAISLADKRAFVKRSYDGFIPEGFSFGEEEG